MSQKCQDDFPNNQKELERMLFKKGHQSNTARDGVGSLFSILIDESRDRTNGHGCEVSDWLYMVNGLSHIHFFC